VSRENLAAVKAQLEQRLDELSRDVLARFDLA
jgi:hypothetical protein